MNFFVGRNTQQCQVIVQDESVSRVHLYVQVQDSNSVTFTDQGSSYGSFYWDKEQGWLSFQEVKLSLNDYVMIGNAKLRVMELLIAYQVKLRDGLL